MRTIKEKELTWDSFKQGSQGKRRVKMNNGRTITMHWRIGTLFNEPVEAMLAGGKFYRVRKLRQQYESCLDEKFALDPKNINKGHWYKKITDTIEICYWGQEPFGRIIGLNATLKIMGLPH